MTFIPLDISQVTEVKNIIQPTMLALASLVDSTELQRLGINVLTGIESKDTIFRYKLNEANARRYNSSKKINAKIGEVDQRELQVKNVYTRTIVNLQDFREKQPFSIIGVSETDPTKLTTPVTQEILLGQSRIFGNQNIRNVIFGEEANDTVEGMEPYSCFNGINYHLQQLINAEKISAAKDNLLKLSIANEDIDKTATRALTAKALTELRVTCYEEFEKCLEDIDEDLANEAINVMLSHRFYEFIIKGGAAKYGCDLAQFIAQTNDVTTIFGHQNVNLLPTKLMGKGVAMNIYRPGIFDLGTDLTRIGDPTSAYVKVGENTSEDMNEVVIQQQVALGTRVNVYESSHLCVVQDKNSKFNTAKTLKEDVKVEDRENPLTMTQEELNAKIAEAVAAAIASLP